MATEHTEANALCCPACGYSLRGLPDDHACPECGFRYQFEAIKALVRIDFAQKLVLAENVISLAAVAGVLALLSLLDVVGERAPCILPLILIGLPGAALFLRAGSLFAALSTADVSRASRAFLAPAGMFVLAQAALIGPVWLAVGAAGALAVAVLAWWSYAPPFRCTPRLHTAEQRRALAWRRAAAGVSMAGAAGLLVLRLLVR